MNYLRNYFNGHSVRSASCIKAKPVIIMLSALNQEKYHRNQIDAWPSAHVQYLKILLNVTTSVPLFQLLEHDCCSVYFFVFFVSGPFN